jgi:hypothetical protein
VVAAALAYRAQSPIIDALLKELGMSGGSLEGLSKAVVPEPHLETLPEAPPAAHPPEPPAATLLAGKKSPPLPRS